MTQDFHSILESWSPPLGVNVALCLAVVVYTAGWFRLHTVFPWLISAWRLAAFFAGIVSVWIAIGSPLAAFDDVSLTVHMAQHLLLMTVAPPLILLGAPALPLLRGLPGPLIRSVVGPVPPMGRCEMVGTRDHQSRRLLAGRCPGADRMAHSAGV